MRYKTIILLFLVTLLSSCASIIKSSTQDVTVSSNPNDAQVRIMDRKNIEVWNSTTPTSVELDRGDGYFRGQKYTVEISKEGYQTSTVTISSGVNGWYIGGNILFGGLIGWLIVDPLTGAMWNLKPDSISVGLSETVGIESSSDGVSLSIVLLSELPAESRDQLVPIN